MKQCLCQILENVKLTDNVYKMVLLCDEPTGALDYNTGKAVLKLLQDTCRQKGKTVIVITHNQALTAMADRIIEVRSGTIHSMRKNDHIVDIADIEW